MAKKKYCTVDSLWEAFKEYKKQTKSQPFKVKDWVGGMAMAVVREKEKPLTMEGFENYCDDIGLIADLSHYKANTNGKYTEFVDVIARIKRHIRQDQIEGGMAFVYNPAITSRLNGLVEKTENKHEVTEIKIVES
jgi:hypothetical protein